jgi:hypothetical protein
VVSVAVLYKLVECFVRGPGGGKSPWELWQDESLSPVWVLAA